MIDFIDPVYLVAVIVFIFGLKAMSSPRTARVGIVIAGGGMLFAVAATIAALFVPSTSAILGVAGTPALTNLVLMAAALAIGGGLGWYAAKVVRMTAMPQMVAIYNGMGGGAAAAIAAVALLGTSGTDGLSVAGAVIGATSFTGSAIAFFKLQGWMRQKPIVYPGQSVSSLAVLVVGVFFGVYAVLTATSFWLLPFFVLVLLYGVLLTLPIGGADMPVAISLFNALTGIAVAMDGFSLSNDAMIVAGILVGAAGTLLTLLMAKAMNRSVSNVLFGAFGATEESAGSVQGSMKTIDIDDAASLLAYAGQVVIAPGYGMAVAQAQQKVKELVDALEAKGVGVKFAIHPVAGRMPGHMNVLLAEAGVPYDHLFDRDEINAEFPATDVVLVIGANDVVNPAARREGSALYGMPILDVDRAHNVLVVKRGQGKGFAGIENELFYRDNCRMLYGDAAAVIGALVQAVKRA